MIKKRPLSSRQLDYDYWDKYRKTEPIRRRRTPVIDDLSGGIPGSDNRWFPSAGQARRAALKRAHQLTRVRGYPHSIKHAPNESGSPPHYHIIDHQGNQLSGHFFYGGRVPYRRLKRKGELELETEWELFTLLDTNNEAEWESKNRGSTLRSIAKRVGKAIIAGQLILFRPIIPDAIPPGGYQALQPTSSQRREKDRGSQGEFEWESEAEITPVQKIDTDTLLEHLGYAAATTESEAEAEAFIGALVPLAARLIPRVTPTIRRSSPGLIGGLSAATKLLHPNPKTRPLLRTFPTILHHTTAQINRQLKQGKKVRPKTAVKILANQAYQVLRNPQQTRRALKHADHFNRRYHGII